MSQESFVRLIYFRGRLTPKYTLAQTRLFFFFLYFAEQQKSDIGKKKKKQKPVVRNVQTL